MARLPTIAYYVSGHGYGHASRAARIIQALAQAGCCAQVQVRTQAPAWLFRSQGALPQGLSPAQVDVGVVEHDARRIDAPATVAALAHFMQGYDQLLERECAWLRAQAVDLVLADASFAAGEAAHRLGLPSAVISNFLWDWIYDDSMFAAPGLAVLNARVRQAYGHFDAFLRLPFHHDSTSIARVQDLPVVSAVRTMDDAAVARALGIDRRHWRSVVLFSYRGALSAQACARLSRDHPGTLFLWAAPLPTGAADLPNLMPTPDGAVVSFQDLVGFADAVVAKLGYGTVADCAVEGKRLLWADRMGYAEDAPLAEGARQWCQGRTIDGEDFEQGRWREALLALLAMPSSALRSAPEGAAEAVPSIMALL